MARPAALDIWMNGDLVGRWERTRTGADQLTYADAWLDSSESRPLSLSLPLAREPLRGPAVVAYFDNLLPDNDRILRRMRERHHVVSTSAFDLLTTVGRDCVGAVQLMRAGESPPDPRRIDCETLDEAGVARILRETTTTGASPTGDGDAFRLSIAGAQEKTALLRHRGRWCIPHGATPSTHIFKLPLGRVGALGVEASTFDDSVADCGKPGLFAITGRRATFNVFVHKVAGGTQVSVNTEFMEGLAFGQSRTTRQCTSRGLLESAILGAVRSGA